MNTCTSFDSPVCLLLPHVFEAPARIAPERAGELSLLTRPVAFRLTDDPGLAFSAAPRRKPPVISVSLRGLEYIWAVSYSTWVLHDHYTRSGSELGIFDFSAFPDSNLGQFPSFCIGRW
jgi:hypothetical protein